MTKSPKTKKIVTPEKDLIVPVGDMQFHGTTEAEYQEPAMQVDPLEREYPDLRQDIPKILKAILRELVIARCGK